MRARMSLTVTKTQRLHCFTMFWRTTPLTRLTSVYLLGIQNNILGVASPLSILPQTPSQGHLHGNKLSLVVPLAVPSGGAGTHIQLPPNFQVHSGQHCTLLDMDIHCIHHELTDYTHQYTILPSIPPSPFCHHSVTFQSALLISCDECCTIIDLFPICMPPYLFRGICWALLCLATCS